MKIAAVVVVYNGIKWMEKCLGSLESSGLKLQTIVIDNASTDGSSNFIKENFPGADLIELNNNAGFGVANNIGIKKALDDGADYVFLLNQDAWIEEVSIPKLIEVAEKNSEYGVISPIHLNGSYTALDFKFAEYIIPQRCPDFISDLYLDKPKDIYEIEFVNAAAWLLSSACLKKTGFFEPMFFLYGEDDNYLQRVEYHRFKIGITPLATICHDREVRKKDRNQLGSETWNRTQSLIVLLDVRKSYSGAIAAFFKQKIYNFSKGLAGGSFKTLVYQVSEFIFFIFNFSKIKKTRKKLRKEPVF